MVMVYVCVMKFSLYNPSAVELCPQCEIEKTGIYITGFNFFHAYPYCLPLKKAFVIFPSGLMK